MWRQSKSGRPECEVVKVCQVGRPSEPRGPCGWWSAGLGAKGVDSGGSREPHQKPEKEDLCHSERAPGRKCRETADPDAGLLKCEVPLYALSRDRTWDMGAETR